MTTNPSYLPAAVIFDMDGVLVDSNPFHVQKWAELLTEHKIPFSEEELPRQILGQRNDRVFHLFFGSGMGETEMREIEARLEENFRRAFRLHAKLLPGLRDLAGELRSAGLPIALASSAMPQNIDFVMDTLRCRSYFSSVMSGDDVHQPKPHPEIYLKTAEKLGIDPAGCIAFEDSFVGIEAAKSAGMKCIAISSTFPAEELRDKTDADLVAPDFQKLSLPVLQSLFSSNTRQF